TQDTTDGLDPETIPEHIDISDHLVVGRSSSAAKKADAVFRISLARRSSAFSRLSLRSSAWVSVDTPDFLPASTSACCTHRRNVSTAILSFGAVCRITVYRLGASSSSHRSITMRAALPLNDGANFPDILP